MPPSSDRNLLFGILALQMDFITREQLVAGMQAWVLAKDIALAEHLVQAGAMKPANRQLLEPLVEAHIRQHGDDPQQSLASISSFEELRGDLADLRDEQLGATISLVPKSAPPKAEWKIEAASLSVGSASSQGTRFRILRPHAEGGLGRVFVAHDGELGREVALKEIKPERADDPDSRGRFTREAEITGGLEHPGIVPVYGLGTYPDGRPFYAMRFIRGKSLKEAIEKFHERFTASGGRQPPDSSAARKSNSPTEENLELRKLLQRLIDVCEAMDYAHSRGVLHRDLKPGNIMLGKYGETLVVDWGLAKPLGKFAGEFSEKQTPTDATLSLSGLPEVPLDPPTSGSEPTILGLALGTPAFMSPEQAQGRLELLGPASDVFSLGAVLYQILSGQPPYVGTSRDDLLCRAKTGDYPPPRSLRPSIAPALEAICLKGLAPLVANRYPTCHALAQDLERFLADEPVSARRDSIPERLVRLTRRHRTAFLTSTIALVVLTLGSLISLGVVNYFRGQATRAGEQLLGKSEELKASNKQIRVRLAASHFQHGVSEYQAGRSGPGVADLRRAIHYLPLDDPLRESYLRILTDRILQGGKTDSPPQNLFLSYHEASGYESPDGTKWVRMSSLDNKLFRIWSKQNGWAVGQPLQHDDLVRYAAFSPDGTKLATASNDKTARIWNSQTGEPLSEPLRHDGWVNHVAFSPDGTKLATASTDQSARIWDAQTGVPQGEPLRHPGMVEHLAFSPDGAHLATASSRGDARIWNIQTGALVGEPLRHPGVWLVAFSPDGTKIATATSDKNARIWDVQTGTPVGEPLRHDSGSFGRIHLAFSPDGTKVATASGENTVRIFDVQRGTLVGGPLLHDAVIQRIAFSPDGSQVTTICGANIARTWNSRSGAPVREPLRLGDAHALALSPDGTKVATSTADKSARIWNMATGAPLGESLRHKAQVFQLAFSPDGSRLATASLDKLARIWNSRTGAPVGKPLRYNPALYFIKTDWAFCPDGIKLATAFDEKTIQIWDSRTGSPVGEPLRHDSIVTHVAFLPDGDRVATASMSQKSWIWDAQSGASLSTAALPHEAIAFSPDQTKAITAPANYTFRILHAETGTPIGDPLRLDGASIAHVAFSPDSTRVAVATDDGAVRIWNTQTGARLGETLRPGGRVAFSPDGTKVATVSNDGVQIWDSQTGMPVGEPLKQPQGVAQLAFSPDGTKLATASIGTRANVFGVPPDKVMPGFDATTRTWHVPQELKLNIGEVETWCAAMTGQHIAENGDLIDLQGSDWSDARKKIEGMNGWQDYLAAVNRRRERYHWIEAEEAEFNKQWFAAAFHLRRALKKEPENEKLMKRLAAAEGKLKEEQEATAKAGGKSEK